MLKNLIMTAVDTDALSTAAESVAETVGGAAQSSFTFMPGEFVKNLSYMGTGMLSIFIVIGVIAIAISALDRVVRSASKK
ncbi:MAG: hypothetical protein IJC98_06985 [Clostridia bacterium]|nr:hypothetical protein [Clostridia bacterium]